MRKQEAFHILEISQDSDEETIKKAYKKMAMKHHPDKGGNPETFKKISQAYNVITNDDEQCDNIDPMDIFSHFFGNRMGPMGMMFAHHGMNMAQQMFSRNVTTHELPLEAFFTGKKLNINNKIFELKQGASINTKISIREQNSELIIHFRPKKHPVFAIDNQGNLVYKHNISLFEALTGTQFRLKHPNGKMMFIQLPNRIMSFQEHLIIPGKGCPLNHGLSNLIIVIDIVMPTHLKLLTEHETDLKRILKFDIQKLESSESDEFIQI